MSVSKSSVQKVEKKGCMLLIQVYLQLYRSLMAADVNYLNNSKIRITYMYVCYIYYISNTYRYRIEVDEKVDHSINCIDSSFHLFYFCAHMAEGYKNKF